MLYMCLHAETVLDLIEKPQRYAAVDAHALPERFAPSLRIADAFKALRGFLLQRDPVPAGCWGFSAVSGQVDAPGRSAIRREQWQGTRGDFLAVAGADSCLAQWRSSNLQAVFHLLPSCSPLAACKPS